MTPICLGNTTGSSTSAKTAQSDRQDAEGRNGRRRILCVDDDPVVLSLQRALLEAAAFSVITARNAEEALRVFSGELPDAVVLDYAMPGTNGAALAARMRRIDEEIPLILNTGYVTVPPDEAELFDRILPKGLAPGLLVRVLREMFPPCGTGSSVSATRPADEHRPPVRDERNQWG